MSVTQRASLCAASNIARLDRIFGRGYPCRGARMSDDRYEVDRSWEYQPFDRDAEFAMFQEYLMLPKKPRQLAHMRVSISGQALEDMAYRYGWKVRAAAWDGHLAKVRAAAAERVTEALAERHARLGFEVTTLAEGQLRRLRKAAEALADDLPRLQDGAILRYLETGIRIEREAAGAAPPQAETLDLSALSVEELRQWRALAAKAVRR